jgi:uncharacterized protein
VYADRAAEDNKLLTYTSVPLETDLEITGTTVLPIQMSSTTSDGAIYAYLEDVSPEGRVTYLDEGILRIIDRKEVDPKSFPYKPLGPAVVVSFGPRSSPRFVWLLQVLRAERDAP